MKESKPEQPQNFEDFIELSQSMTPEEAVAKLGEFHNATPESVLEAFMSLRDFVAGEVIFKRSVTKGHECIIMKGFDGDGKQVWSHLIDMYTGQPIMHTS